MAHDDFRPRVYHADELAAPHPAAVVGILILGVAAIGGEMAILPKSKAHTQTYAQTPHSLKIPK